MHASESSLGLDQLANREPAVDDKVMPVHVLGLVGRQVHGRPGDVLHSGGASVQPLGSGEPNEVTKSFTNLVFLVLI